MKSTGTRRRNDLYINRIKTLSVFIAIGLMLVLSGNEAPASHDGIATLVASSPFGTGVLDVSFTVIVGPASDPGCLAPSWTLNFGDGDSETGESTGTFIVAHQYSNLSSSTKIFIAELSFMRQGQHEARGPRCETSITLTQAAITVDSPIPLIAVILEHERIVGPPPVEVGFDGSATQSDAACPVSSFTWDFGDGTTATGAMLSHSFMSLGLYEITLSVEDRCGRNDSTKSVVFARRIKPDGFDEIAASVEEIRQFIQDANDSMDDGTMLIDDEFPGPFGELGRGAGAGALASTVQGRLESLCAQDSLTEADNLELDPLIALLEQMVARLGNGSSPDSEAKQEFEDALEKVRSAKVKLSSDPAGARQELCANNGASMLVDSGLDTLSEVLRQHLLTLQGQCGMLQTDVADLIMSVQDVMQGYGQLLNQSDGDFVGSFDNSALKAAIGEALDEMFLLPAVLDQAQLLVQSLCAELDQLARELNRLFEGSQSSGTPESVAKLQRSLLRVRDLFQQTRETIPLEGQHGGGRSNGLEGLINSKDTPTVLDTFGCFGHWASDGMMGTPGSDTITGTDKGEVISALGGDDDIDGKGGDDYICAGPGNDGFTFFTGVHGGHGFDRIDGGSGYDGINGDEDSDIILGGPDADVLNDRLGPKNWLFGESGGDTIAAGGTVAGYGFGDIGNDRLKPADSENDGDGFHNGGVGSDAFDFYFDPGDFDECNGGPDTDFFTNPDDDIGCETIISIP